MLALIGSCLNLSQPSRFTDRREYEVFARAPAAAPTHFFGTLARYRYGAWHASVGEGGSISSFPEPQDSFNDDTGIIESGTAALELVAPAADAPFIPVADNKALDCDGVDDYLYTASTAKLNFGTGSFTVILRVRYDDFTFPRSFCSVGKQGAVWNTSAGWGFGAVYDAAAIPVFFHDGATFLQGTIALDAGFRPPDCIGRFVDIAIVVNRSAGVNKATAVIEGVAQSGSIDLSTLVASFDNAQNFNWGISVGWMQDGAGDELQLFNRALPVAEIQALRRKRLTGKETGLVLWWKNDEGAGVAVADSSGNGHGASFNSAPAWTQGAPLDVRDQFFRIPQLLQQQLIDLELVTRIYREDGTSCELVNERRGVVKSARRRKHLLTLEVADVDRSAFDQLIPAKRFTVADWPKLFVDHVGRPITQGVGTVRKMPLTYIDNTAGAFKYAGPEVIGSAATLLTLYRNNRVVSPAEYVTGTAAAGGNTVFTATFTKEQADFNGSLYELTADFLCPGSRLAADEVRRVLGLLGVGVDASSFDIAALYHNLEGIRVDCAYATPRPGTTIIQDLLFVARGQLFKTPAGQCGLFVDRPRDVKAALDEAVHQCEIEEDVTSEKVKSITLEYRPSTSQKEEYTGKLTRACSGVAAERVLKNPYIDDHGVADRTMSYLQKRENAKNEARAAIFAAQLRAGDLVALTSAVSLNGSKVYAAPQISRPADRNVVTLRAYDESIFVYTADALPAGAVNGYLPDYSQTQPVMPTGLAVVSQGTSSDTDGKVTAYLVARAVPPAVNWAQLFVQLVDTTTGEQYTQELFLTGGNYDATFSGLRPGRIHSIRAWAVNATNVEGATATIANFTTANYTTQPNAPASIASQQQSPRQVLVGWAAVADVAGQPKIRRYVVFKKTGGGSYTEVDRPNTLTWIDDNVAIGTAYQYKVRAEDINGNESNDSSASGSLTPTALITDGLVTGGGISGVSIANGSINRGRANTATGSASGTTSNATYSGFQAESYCFDLAVFSSTDFNYLDLKSPTGSGNEVSKIQWYNNTGSSRLWEASYRYVAS